MEIQILRLRRQLTLLWGVLALTLLTAAAGNLHPLYLANATNQPSAPVSLSGANWTGTLDGARLPALAPALSGGSGTLNLAGFTLSLPTGAVASAIGGASIAPATVTTAKLGGAASGDLTLFGNGDMANTVALGFSGYTGITTLSVNAPTLHSAEVILDYGRALDLTGGANVIAFAGGALVSDSISTNDTLALGTRLGAPGNTEGSLELTNLSAAGNISASAGAGVFNELVIVGGSYNAGASSYDGIITSNAAILAGGGGVVLYSSGSGVPYQLHVDDSGNLSATPY